MKPTPQSRQTVAAAAKKRPKELEKNLFRGD
jgi:hypothetical protein